MASRPIVFRFSRFLEREAMRLNPLRKVKKIYLFSLLPLLAVGGMFTSHEVAVRYFPEISCNMCHEMTEPVRKWRESGAAKNHPNCVGCHFESGFKGFCELNKSAALKLVEHFKRDPDKPIEVPCEPLFLDLSKEPGYYSLVPNSRCFQCKDALNHKAIDQPRIHSKLIQDISRQPCKDCHNHEMREGQKFYEKVLPGQKPPTVQPAGLLGSLSN